MANPFFHIQLQATDVERARTFYGALLDWKMQDVPMGAGSYTMIDTGVGREGVGGGITHAQADQKHPQWVTYVRVDDVSAATERARELGATIAQPRTDIPNMGSFSVIVDPIGAVLGLWQDAK